jgi:hypothetical protein
MTENCYKRLCDENKLQKTEKKRTSGSENLIGCDVAETAPPFTKETFIFTKW